MRRYKRSHNMNLDSLMDTMTNVVGILVILLAVTQLSVAHTVRQIKSRGTPSGVSAEDFREAEEGLKELEDERERLEELLAQYQSQIEQAKHDIETLRQLAELQQLVEATGERQLPDKRTLEANIADLERRIADLREKIAAIEKEIEAKRSALATAYKKGGSVTEIGIPVLTPAPSNQEPVCFICRGGRVYPFNVEPLGERFMKMARQITGQRTGNINVDPSDLTKMVTYLNEHDVGDEYFRLKLESLVIVARLRFEPRRPNQGETASQFSADNSLFMQRLKSMDPQEQYLKFFVWSDSFETYTAAKDLAHRVQGKLHGTWIPYDKEEELAELLGGGSSGGGGGPQWQF